MLLSEDLKEELDIYVKSLEKENPSLRITRVRHTEQKGLSHARVSGWSAATADVVAILDAHIEVHEMWYIYGAIWSYLTSPVHFS